MGVMDNTDDALNKAAEVEVKYLAENDPEEKAKLKKSANLFFQRAMKNDGTLMPDGEKVIP